MDSEQLKQTLAHRSLLRKCGVVVAVVAIVFGFAIAAIGAYANSFHDRVLPGVHIGTVPVGGMTRDELKRFLEEMNDKLVAEGLHFNLEANGQHKELTLYPVIVSQANSFELIRIDVDRAVDAIIHYGKQGSVVSRVSGSIRGLVAKPNLAVVEAVDISQEEILAELEEFVSPYTANPVDARVEITSLEPLDYTVVSSSPGVVFHHDQALDALKTAWAMLEVPHISIMSQVAEPHVTDKDIEPLLPRLGQILAQGGIELVYEDPHTRRSYSWDIGIDKIADWLAVDADASQGTGFGLSMGSTTFFLQEVITPEIEVEAEDAKFEITDGKVTQFQGSRPGVTVDLEKTFAALHRTVLERNWSDQQQNAQVAVVTEQIEPRVKTGEINDLGISEVLGAGISSYKGSPTNRIKNIRNSVNKLNGVLIKPGEEFSTITYTQPYTEEGGYLPELVIKGDEIKPEIGGGLCQIGTTLFRMAMNSAMPITQRRNHSLVVSYYNDPENGLPGTDATIYEPAPDFKFKNDSSNYVLVQAHMDESKQELIFTLWGTSDGRQGFYSAPVVNRWIPAGEKRIVETTKLEPGQTKCQKPYRGADASFVYTRKLPDGSLEERVFESHYRPLPEICLVGVEEQVVATECVEGEECEAAAEEAGSEAGNQPTAPDQPVIVE